MTLSDIDTQAGVIHVTKAFEKRAKNSPPVVKTTKTEENRSVPIHPALMPLLELLKASRITPVSAKKYVVTPPKLVTRLDWIG